MPPAEDRQAKALQGIEQSTKSLVRVMEALNTNLLGLAKYIKEIVEKEEANNTLSQFPLECGCGVLHCNYHLIELDRQKRAAQEESMRGTNPDSVEFDEIDWDANKVMHTSEFNNPEHRPFVFHTKIPQVDSVVFSRSFGLHGIVTATHAERSEVAFESGANPVWIPNSDLKVLTHEEFLRLDHSRPYTATNNRITNDDGLRGTILRSSADGGSMYVRMDHGDLLWYKANDLRVVPFSKDDTNAELLTPAEWMNKLKRWWNYQSVDTMETTKMTEGAFFAYMESCPGTEITHQVPDKYKGEGSE